MAHRRVLVYWVAFIVAGPAAADDQSPPNRVLGVDVTGALRGRVENWDWFRAPGADNFYTYVATVLRINLRKAVNRMEWQAEGSFPLFLNLPRTAVAPEPAGPLGYGGDYFEANGQPNIGAAVLRQAFVSWKNETGNFKFRAGRFEFADGAEASPSDPDLAALKKERINQRLIATFNYALRSLDGAQFTYDRNGSNVTFMASRLVEGSFQLRALGEIDAEVGYAAYTRYFPFKNGASELRVFVVPYWDQRPIATSDGRAIRLATPGAHFITQNRFGPGKADLVLWTAGQFGVWGNQTHRAAEVAAEAGYRFGITMQPWIRIGYLRSTGDSDPNDNRHSTFFQVLSSPRNYARFPFYILMNTDDRFIQFNFTANRKLAIHSEVHSVRLSNANDLWYDGGGAFQEESFGYLGRPSGGHSRVGTSFDVSADYALAAKTTVSLYGGVARGSAVPPFVFRAGGSHPVVHVLSIEVVRRF